MPVASFEVINFACWNWVTTGYSAYSLAFTIKHLNLGYSESHFLRQISSNYSIVETEIISFSE